MAAKQRRQKVIAAVLGVVLIAVLAYEVPNLLKAFGGKSAPRRRCRCSADGRAPEDQGELLKALRRTRPSDPFARRWGSTATRHRVTSALPAGSIDPFAPGARQRRDSERGAAARDDGPLPQTIVIGTPGGNRKAKHGWIVILASIPTAEGRRLCDQLRREGAATTG